MSIIPKCPICWGKCKPDQCETKQQPDALRLADALTSLTGTQKDKHTTAKQAADELRRLHQHELALKEWLDKTEWVQETHEAYEHVLRSNKPLWHRYIGWICQHLACNRV